MRTCDFPASVNQVPTGSAAIAGAASGISDKANKARRRFSFIPFSNTGRSERLKLRGRRDWRDRQD
jgi:hypothetical protein